MSINLLDELRDRTAPPFLPVTADQYQQMIETGILHDGDPVELLDGLLAPKDRSACGETLKTHHPRHALLIKRLQRLLSAASDAAGCHLQSQFPVSLSSNSVPEPDIAVVHGNEDDYGLRHPGPEDLLLVVEVADSSLATDRSTKQRLYAMAGIPRYWIVNLVDIQIEVSESPEPSSGKYLQQTIWTSGQKFRWDASPSRSLEIIVADLLR
jgi:Uma2 family endonuclease